MLLDETLKEHFYHHMFHGADFDSSMLRIGAMNMTLHGIDNPSIEDRDSLSEDHSLHRNAYTLILANPPFKSSLDFDGTAKDLLQVCKTKKNELLFISLFLQQLKPGGRARASCRTACCLVLSTRIGNCAKPWWNNTSSRLTYSNAISLEYLPIFI